MKKIQVRSTRKHPSPFLPLSAFAHFHRSDFRGFTLFGSESACCVGPIYNQPIFRDQHLMTHHEAQSLSHPQMILLWIDATFTTLRRTSDAYSPRNASTENDLDAILRDQRCCPPCHACLSTLRLDERRGYASQKRLDQIHIRFRGVNPSSLMPLLRTCRAAS